VTFIEFFIEFSLVEGGSQRDAAAPAVVVGASGRLAAGGKVEGEAVGFQVQPGRIGGGREWGDWGIAAC